MIGRRCGLVFGNVMDDFIDRLKDRALGPIVRRAGPWENLDAVSDHAILQQRNALPDLRMVNFDPPLALEYPIEAVRTATSTSAGTAKESPTFMSLNGYLLWRRTELP